MTEWNPEVRDWRGLLAMAGIACATGCWYAVHTGGGLALALGATIGVFVGALGALATLPRHQPPAGRAWRVLGKVLFNPVVGTLALLPWSKIASGGFLFGSIMGFLLCSMIIFQQILQAPRLLQFHLSTCRFLFL